MDKCSLSGPMRWFVWFGIAMLVGVALWLAVMAWNVAGMTVSVERAVVEYCEGKEG